MKYPIENKIQSFARSHHLWKPGDRILAAVSGGPDSLGLLCFLARISREEEIDVGCCVVNHHLRPEAEEEALYVKKMADTLHIPCWIQNIYVEEYRKKNGGSVETVARMLRYQALNEVMKAGSFNLMAVAHHMDDQAETVLYHLIRGSGTRGLSGMQPKRGYIIRPLLCVSKREIAGYIMKLGISACHDKTNDIPDGARNKIRLLLLPTLRKMNPKITESLCRTADILQADQAWMEEEVKKFLSRYSSRQYGVLFVKREPWLQSRPAFSRSLIRFLLNQWRKKSEDVDFDGIERIRKFIFLAKNGGYTSLGGAVFWRANDDMAVFPGNSREPLPAETLAKAYFYHSLPKSVGEKLSAMANEKTEPAWKLTIQKIKEKPSHLTKNQYVLPAGAAGKLQVRHADERDRFHPRGLARDVNLLNYMQSLKIPGALRRVWPILADDERVYWVPPFRGAAIRGNSSEKHEYLLVTIS